MKANVKENVNLAVSLFEKILQDGERNKEKLELMRWAKIPAITAKRNNRN